jgi:hypothetical protein
MHVTKATVVKARAPKSRCEGLFYVMNGIVLGSFIFYVAKTQGSFHDLSSSASASSVVSKCPSTTASNRVRRGQTYSQDIFATGHHDPTDNSYNSNFSLLETCLDPEGPVPVILMSLGRSGTDSTWQILKNLTGTKMKAIEIVGGSEDETVDFFRAVEGLRSEADTWALDETYDWRAKGGSKMSTRGFYFHIKDFCANGNCIDGKWIFKWFCEEQQRYKEIGGLVGFKWKAYMSALRTKPAHNALKLVAELGVSNTPIRVIRSRRNILDVYLSELKHSLQDDLPDHCKADNADCIQKHASIRLFVPVDEMFEWLLKAYDEEDEIDSLLSGMGIRTVHVEYDELYYAQTEQEGLKQWYKIFKFLDQRHDWTWDDIAGAAGIKPTTKSRSHKVLIDNFDEVFGRLKGTKLERFVRNL